MWFQGEGQLHIADLILAVAVICAACGYAFGAKLSKEMGGWRVTCWSLAISLPFLLIPTLTHLPSNVSDIPFQAMIFVCLFSPSKSIRGLFVLVQESSARGRRQGKSDTTLATVYHAYCCRAIIG